MNSVLVIFFVLFTYMTSKLRKCNRKSEKYFIKKRRTEESTAICDETYSEEEFNDKQRFLRAFLARLHERQRRIFMLRLRGCTYDEIERLTGLPATSLRMTVSRLKRELINSYKQKTGNV